MCDVGTISGETFDIDSVDETESLLVRSDTAGTVRTRWIFRNEANAIVIHERAMALPQVIPAGTLLKISPVPGCAAQGDIGSSVREITHVARTAVPIDWDDTSGFTTREVVGSNGEVYECVLAPVVLL